MRRVFLYWLPVVLFSVLVLYVSLGNPPEGPDIDNLDKFVHFGTYLALGALWARALSRGVDQSPDKRTVFMIAAFVTFAFGAGVEFLQGFFPQRSTDFFDAVANGAGGIAGSYVHAVLLKGGR